MMRLFQFMAIQFIVYYGILAYAWLTKGCQLIIEIRYWAFGQFILARRGEASTRRVLIYTPNTAISIIQVEID